MYELANRLREVADEVDNDYDVDPYNTEQRCLAILEAANAIEELSRKETPMKITEIHVDEYFCPACGAENNCDQGHVQDAYCPACGQRLLPQQPKEG